MNQSRPSSREMMWADGGTIFAAVLLATVGVFQVLEGISAIAKDDVFVKAPDYVFDIDLTAWGWVHLLIGAVAVLIGVSILYGQGWAMIAGIVIAIVSALSNFMFLPFYPLWALVVIGFDLFVIWSLSTVYGQRAARGA